MRIKDVVTLKEVVSDLNDGKAFYDRKETGVGDYFWDSLITDIESLRIYASPNSLQRDMILKRLLSVKISQSAVSRSSLTIKKPCIRY